MFMGLLELLASTGASIADDSNNPSCHFMNTQSDYKTSAIYYINPKEVSYLIKMEDKEQGASIIGEYMLVVVMNNGDRIVYGRYKNMIKRDNVMYYIFDNVVKCKK